jgi:hypothetical protein
MLIVTAAWPRKLVISVTCNHCWSGWYYHVFVLRSFIGQVLGFWVLSITNGANESASTVRETIIQIHSKRYKGVALLLIQWSSGAIELPYDVEGDSQEVNNAAKGRDDQANGELNEVHQSSESEKDKQHVPDNAATTSRSNVQCKNSHVQNDQKYEIISVPFEMLLSYKTLWWEK